MTNQQEPKEKRQGHNFGQRREIVEWLEANREVFSEKKTVAEAYEIARGVFGFPITRNTISGMNKWARPEPIRFLGSRSNRRQKGGDGGANHEIEKINAKIDVLTAKLDEFLG